MNVRLFLTVLVFIAMFTLIGYSQASRQAPQGLGVPGRFQIVQGRYQISAGASTLEGAGMFKIDSQTGQTWIYREGSGDSRPFWSEWRLIDETTKR